MMLQVLTVTAYAFSVISFVLFVYLLLTRKTLASGLGDARQQAGLDDIAKILEALAKLTDSFAKAGPLVMTLVSAIFFFLIALMGSGFDTVARK
jgi:hypothetical protein